MKNVFSLLLLILFLTSTPLFSFCQATCQQGINSCAPVATGDTTCEIIIPGDAILVMSNYQSDLFPGYCFYVCPEAILTLGISAVNGGNNVYVEPFATATINMNECCIVARAPSTINLEANSAGSVVYCEPGVDVYINGVLQPGYCDSGCPNIIYDTGALPSNCNTGVEAFNPLAAGIKIFPNPASEMVTISARNINAGLMDIAIFSPEGEMTFNGTFQDDENNLVIPLTKFSKGFYLVRIESPSGVAVKSLSIQ